MTEINRRILFTLLFSLVLYVAGASFVQSFVNYPAWKMIGANEFQAYHVAMSSRIIPIMVLPWFVEIALTFVVMRFRPRSVTLPAISLAQVFNLIALFSTVFIQIPIQIQLGEGSGSLHALDMLIETDPIRWVSLILKLFVYAWIMWGIISAEEADGTPENLI